MLVLRALLYTFILLLFSMMPVCVSPSWAKLQVSPSIVIREAYNDNIYLEEEKEDEFITTVAPYLAAILDTRSINVELTYGFEFRLHSNRSELDETDPGDAQRASLKADLFPDRDFTVNIFEEFYNVAVDERRPFVEENLVVNRTNFNRFLINPSYRYRRWPTFTATLNYQYENLAYDSDLGNDSDRHRAGLELEKRISEKFSISTGYAHAAYRSDDANDYRSDDIFIDFIHRISPKLTLDARGGVMFFDRSESGESTELLLNLKADYSLTEQIILTLSYDETVYDSVSLGLVRGRAGIVSLDYNRHLPIKAALTVKEADYLDTDREDLSAGAIVQMTMTFRNRVSIGAEPYVTWLKFKPEDDNSLRYGLALSVQKVFRYGHLRFGYNYHVSENNEIYDDYKNNIVFLEALFSLGGTSGSGTPIQNMPRQGNSMGESR